MLIQAFSSCSLLARIDRKLWKCLTSKCISKISVCCDWFFHCIMGNCHYHDSCHRLPRVHTHFHSHWAPLSDLSSFRFPTQQTPFLFFHTIHARLIICCYPQEVPCVANGVIFWSQLGGWHFGRTKCQTCYVCWQKYIYMETIFVVVRPALLICSRFTFELIYLTNLDVQEGVWVTVWQNVHEHLGYVL